MRCPGEVPAVRAGAVIGVAGQIPEDDVVLLCGRWSDGNTRVENDRGEAVPEIPLPFHCYVAGYRCWCGRKFWTQRGYQGHYALIHVLALREWVHSETRRFWRRCWYERNRDLLRRIGSAR